MKSHGAPSGGADQTAPCLPSTEIASRTPLQSPAKDASAWRDWETGSSLDHTHFAPERSRSDRVDWVGGNAFRAAAGACGRGGEAAPSSSRAARMDISLAPRSSMAISSSSPISRLYLLAAGAAARWSSPGIATWGGRSRRPYNVPDDGCEEPTDGKHPHYCADRGPVRLREGTGRGPADRRDARSSGFA